MSKTIKKCYFDKLTYINLYNAYLRVCKNNKNKKYLLKYDIDVEINISNLLYELKNMTYIPGEYKCFTIYEPKERKIMALPLRDRIVHQWYVEEFIKPYIISRFIYDSYSCIEGKGTIKGVNRLQKFMRVMYSKNNNYYVLKCDIEKYFYNVDKDILFFIMKKYFSDKTLLELTKVIIFDNIDGKGIPIGNYTSQYFANIYLNELDYYIKEVLRVRYYIRYMDDFVLLLDSKSECTYILNKIGNFLRIRLRLRLNKKSKYFHNKNGIDFLGYRLFNDYRLIRKRNIKKLNRKIIKWRKKYDGNLLNENEVILSFNSFLEYVKHCDSYRFVNCVKDKLVIDNK